MKLIHYLLYYEGLSQRTKHAFTKGFQFGIAVSVAIATLLMILITILNVIQ